MKMPEISLLEWQKRYGTERACVKELTKIRWPEGFQCPACGSIKACYIATRKLYQCSKCRHQVSITADTLLHATKLPLVKWFWVIYLVASDKGGISALRTSKHLGVSWITARNMLRKIRKAMAHRDSIYRLANIIEFDDTYVGGKRAGKRGRGAEGKTPVLVAVETREKGAGFVAMQAVDTVSNETVRKFLSKHLEVGQTVKTDALPALNAVKETQQHEKRVTPPEKVSGWLPLVHIMIGNMKQFINGTFHGVSSSYLQEYLDEFCYRFNRRFWEPELPLRLLNACLAHGPVKLAEFA
jgi:transposase-like protein/DNA-directed RNA polymerase subunit RPC12/RpoP